MMSTPSVRIGEELTPAEVEQVARRSAAVEISPAVRGRMEASHAYVRRAVHTALDPQAAPERKRALSIYGVTTGFGSLKERSVTSEDEAVALQRNLLLSTACGTGPPLPTEVVRAALLLRAHTLAAGYSGVRFALVERLVALLNHQVHPIVPEQGSLGCSGDLCPLAHLALVLLGRGEAEFDGQRLPGADALRRAGLESARAPRFEISFKEGLALINGTTMMTALSSLALLDAERIAAAADIIAALSAEALGARLRAFDPRLHRVRRHPWQQRCAANLRRLWRGSGLIDQNGEVQDSYSIRCAPVVHGASRDAIAYVRGTVEREINAITDNPLVFLDDGEPVIDDDREDRSFSGGNFHGQPLALAADFLAIALAELANIAERRCAKLLDPHHNCGLPAMLSPFPGLHSGLMIVQYTAAALVSENKVLCHPASIDSIPTSANAEDHNSMGMGAALKLRRVVDNVAGALAAELLCAIQALDLRRGRIPGAPRAQIGAALGAGTAAALAAARLEIEPLHEDRELAPDLERARRLILSDRLRQAVEPAAGALE
ncbi:MAG TPA: histidine ammonia-lyase [Acidobacteriota bacterium]